MNRRDSKHGVARGLSMFLLVVSLGLIWAAGASATPAPTAPSIESEWVSGLTHTDATLEADIDTGGLETHYQFRLAYGCGFPGAGEVCPQYCIAGQPCPGPQNSVITVPLPIADLSPSTDIQHVSLDLNSVGVMLQPYKYRYSIEATNDEGTAKGPDQYFTPPSESSPPPSSPSAPSIEGESVSKIKSTEATLEAEIDPNGLETEYEIWLEYAVCQNPPPGSASCFAIAVEPRATGTIPASSSGQAISTTLTGLDPGYTYNFWVVATNTAGKDKTTSQPFKTLTAPPGKPVVESTWISDLTTDDVTLHATINPQGLDTEYKFFLYEPCPKPGPGEVSCQAIAVLPLPGGTIPGSFEPVSVSVSASEGGYSLKPGIEYEWAIRASNEEGQTFPDGQPFFGKSLPVVKEEPAVKEGDTPGATADSSANAASSSAPAQPSPKADPPTPPGVALKKHCKRRPRHIAQKHRRAAHRAPRCIR